MATGIEVGAFFGIALKAKGPEGAALTRPDGSCHSEVDSLALCTQLDSDLEFP